MVRANAADTAPSMVSVRLFVVPAVVLALPERVNVPLLLVICTWPETVTPLGKFATVTAYGPLAMFAVVTV